MTAPLRIALEHKVVSDRRKRGARANPSAKPFQPASSVLCLSSPADFVQALMFMNEFGRQGSLVKRRELRPISFFLGRTGGFELLLLLLNAAYQKPAAGRVGGWPFGALLPRINVSERTLRTLLSDLVQAGYVKKFNFQIDHRYIVYCLERHVIAAWNCLFIELRSHIGSVLDSYSPDTLANIDYSLLDFSRPLCEQHLESPVVRHLKSAFTAGARTDRMKAQRYGKFRQVDERV